MTRLFSLPRLLATLALSVAISAGASSSLAAQSPGAMMDHPSVTGVSYTKDVVPIFEARCVSCHGGRTASGQTMVADGLNMTSYEALMAGSDSGAIVEPGGPDASVLIQTLASGTMPMVGEPLSQQELEIIRAWIAEGADNN